MSPISTFTFTDGVTTSSDIIITQLSYDYNNKDKLISVVIGEGVTTIGVSAFENCIHLTSITLPDSLITIESFSIKNTNINTLIIPKNVTTIGTQAFYLSNTRTTYIILNPSIILDENVGTSIYTASAVLFLFYRTDSAPDPENTPLIYARAPAEAYKKYISDEMASIKFTFDDNTVSYSQDSIITQASYDYNKKDSLISVTSTNYVYSSIVSFGDNCFQNCSKLSNVIIPKYVTSIGNNSFNGCSSLNTITYDDASIITTLGTNVFYGISLCDVTFGKTDEAPAATSGTIYDTSLYPPGSNFTYLDISNYQVAFEYNNQLTEYSNDILISSSSYTSANKSNLTSVICGKYAPVLSIQAGTFKDCSNLTTLILSEYIEIISHNAFHSCNISTLILPSSIKEIGNAVFQNNNTGLTLYVLNPSIINVGITAVFATSSPNIVYYYNTPNIPTETDNTIFNTDLYTNNTTFNYLTYEQSSVTFYFDDNSSELYDSGYKITSSSYNNKKNNLISVIIGDFALATTIGIQAFLDCTKLTSILIPDSITSILTEAFKNCNKLETIKYQTPADITIGANIFNSTPAMDVTFYSTSGSPSTGVYDQSIYANGSSFTNLGLNELATKFTFTDIDPIYSNDIVISSSSYGENNTTLLTVEFTIYNDFPKVLPTNINKSTFANCAELTDVINFPSSISVIPDYCFQNCNKLVNITLPDTITTIDRYAFSYCSLLTSINIPENVGEIGSYAFQYTGITSIIIPNSTTIGIGMCKGCSSLTYIKLPDNLTSIPNDLCLNCSSLVNIDIPNTVEVFGDGSFYGCKNLNNITIPINVTTIGNATFFWCQRLKYMYVLNPLNITNIGESSTFTFNSHKYGGTGTDVYFYKTESGPSAPEELTGIYGSSTFSSGTRFHYISTQMSSMKFIFNNTVEYSDDDVLSQSSYSYANKDNLISVIPENSKYIWRNMIGVADNAFLSCSNLNDITFPKLITSLGDNMLDGCGNLRYINYENPKIITTLGTDMFANTSNILVKFYNTGITPSTTEGTVYNTTLYNYSSYKYIPYLDAIALYFDNQDEPDLLYNIESFENDSWDYDNKKDNLTLVIFGENCGVIELGYRALYNTSLTNVILQEGLETIGHETFANNPNLTTITIPSTVTSMKNNIFANSTSLNEIIYLNPNNVSTLNITGIVPSNTTKTVYYYNTPSGPNAPGSVTNTVYDTSMYGSNTTFNYISNEMSGVKFTFNDSAEPIYTNDIILDASSYNNNIDSLIDISFGKEFSRTTTIDFAAFKNCTQLTSIKIPNTITTVGDYAFEGCSLLENIAYQDPSNITIGGDVNSLAFLDTPDMNVRYYNTDGEPTTGVYNTSLYTIYSTFEYISVEILGVKFEFDYGPVLYSTDTVINAASYGEATDLVNVILRTDYDDFVEDIVQVTEIADSAFADNTLLTNIIIPETVTTMGSNIFNNTSIESIAFNDPLKITSVGSNWFTLSYPYVPIDPLSVVYYFTPEEITTGGVFERSLYETQEPYASDVQYTYIASGPYAIEASIVIEPISTQLITTKTYEIVEPISNSTGDFTYTSSNDSIASVSGNVINIHTTGVVTITATQSATYTFLESSETVPFTIKLDPLLSGFSVPTKTIADEPFVLTPPTSAAVDEPLPTDFSYTILDDTMASISDATVTILNSGETIITAILDETEIYGSASISAPFIVLNQLVPNLSNFSIPEKIYGEYPFTLTPPDSDSPGSFIYSSSDASVAVLNNDILEITGNGSCLITAEQQPSGIYVTASISSAFVAHDSTTDNPAVIDSANNLSINYFLQTESTYATLTGETEYVDESELITTTKKVLFTQQQVRIFK